MGKYTTTSVGSLLLVILVTLAYILPSSLACPTCPLPTPPPPKKKPPPPPPKPCAPPPPPKPKPKPKPCPPPPKAPAPARPTCPIDTLKLDACVDLLGGLVNIGIGADTKQACCPLLEGLVDADAALCLCTTIKAKLLNLNILLPIAVELLLDCGKHWPTAYQCAA